VSYPCCETIACECMCVCVLFCSFSYFDITTEAKWGKYLPDFLQKLQEEVNIALSATRSQPADDADDEESLTAFFARINLAGKGLEGLCEEIGIEGVDFFEDFSVTLPKLIL